MGSYSASTSIATDNRLAVTDQGFGLSSSGTNNNTALKGHILNISAPAAPGYKGTGGTAGNINVNLLDNDAIDKAFDFAAYSLSETLGSIINSNKQTATQIANAQQYSMETIGQAINSAATTTAQAQEQTAKQNSDTVRKGLLIAAAAAGAWYLLFKGKK